jgi:hypothetical protein
MYRALWFCLLLYLSGLNIGVQLTCRLQLVVRCVFTLALCVADIRQPHILAAGQNRLKSLQFTLQVRL